MAKSFAKYLLVAFLLVSFIIPSCLTADAADTTTFTIEVKYGQTEARSMLDMINKFRTGKDAWYWNEKNTEKLRMEGLSALEYDYKLEEIAMQRAAEISISFSHTRPDGSSTSSLFSGTGNTAYGENIAYGFTSASSVFTAWQETNENYSGQGHRRNMLSDYFTTVGIGHAVIDGVHFWVQEFGNKNSGQAKTSALDGYKNVTITAKSSLAPTTTTTKSTTTTTKPSTTTTTKPSTTTTTKPSTVATTKQTSTATSQTAATTNAANNSSVPNNTTVNSTAAGGVTTSRGNTSLSQADPPRDNDTAITADAVWGDSTEKSGFTYDAIQTEGITEAAPKGPSDAGLYAGLAAAVAVAGVCTFIILRTRKKKDE